MTRRQRIPCWTGRSRVFTAKLLVRQAWKEMT
jgi:hypothetical protein